MTSEQMKAELIKQIQSMSNEQLRLVLAAWNYSREHPDKSAKECVDFAYAEMTAAETQN